MLSTRTAQQLGPLLVFVRFSIRDTTLPSGTRTAQQRGPLVVFVCFSIRDTTLPSGTSKRPRSRFVFQRCLLPISVGTPDILSFLVVLLSPSREMPRCYFPQGTMISFRIFIQFVVHLTSYYLTLRIHCIDQLLIASQN
jgi:hypothetical protein